MFIKDLTDKELINEMLNRFIIPQFYTKQHIEESFNNGKHISNSKYKLFNIYLSNTTLYNEIDNMLPIIWYNFENYLKFKESI